jgi:hypothetical protein
MTDLIGDVKAVTVKGMIICVVTPCSGKGALSELHGVTSQRNVLVFNFMDNINQFAFYIKHRFDILNFLPSFSY